MDKAPSEVSFSSSATTSDLKQDRVVMYCSYFSYGQNGAIMRSSYASKSSASFTQKINLLENQKLLPKEATQLMEMFFDASDSKQREYLEKKPGVINIIRTLTQIIEKSASDSELIMYALAHLDGILEDKRSRVKYFVEMIDDVKNPCNIVQVMNTFIMSRQEPEFAPHRDIAAHINALVIEAINFDRIEGSQSNAEEFLSCLVSSESGRKMTYISPVATTFALMTIMRQNELARKFVTPVNMDFVSKTLEKVCQTDAQVSYQVLCMLWILSNHQFAQEFFESFDLELLEKAAKLLDFHNKEKNVRIFLLLIDNMKEVKAYEEHMSDIDVLSVIIKLQNRYWVDPELTTKLDELQEYFEENQKNFSSVEKLMNQVKRKNLKWGPCHTEEFWRENSPIFDKKDEFQIMIKSIVNDCLAKEASDRVKAVACFDLGEFAKYSAYGKKTLDGMHIREKMAELMQDPDGSAELKKEAITCYQKILIDSSWTAGSFS